MWRGLYTAATGMISEMQRTDVIANNLANANTSGFKRSETINKEFAPMLIRRVDDMAKDKVTSFKGFHLEIGAPMVGQLGLGTAVDEVALDNQQGAMQSTGNPLDLAIAGDGYFAVDTPQGVRYTRDGAFFRTARGEIQNVKGQALLDTKGKHIFLPQDAKEVIITPSGEVTLQDGQQIAQIQITSFGPDRRAMLRQGDNLYVPNVGARQQVATGEIQQGMLERSNVNIVSDMVGLINNHRVYEAGSKAVTTQDTLLDKSVNDVGRLS